ncbi:MAG: cardiolipin synthase [Oscillospiraceae bacterium]|nr:cardiolipin synthase [Oscillospiraceae bacterium]
MSNKKAGESAPRQNRKKPSPIRLLKLMTHRVFWIGFAIFVQLVALLLIPLQFRQLYAPFEQICTLLSLVMAVVIVNKKGNPSFQIAWLFTMMFLPLFGWLLYLLFGGKRLSPRTRKYIQQARRTDVQAQRGGVSAQVVERRRGADAGSMARYLEGLSCPAYERAQVEYFPLGEDQFASMLERLRTAKKYIFVEYFIIEPGRMWDSILEILKEKVLQGVEVRVLYDDMGCIFTLPHNYRKSLERLGIHCAVFNRFLPVLSVRANNRSHQKMLIIDGEAAYTGGVNLADEYINEKERFGHWKDTGVLVEGQAAWGMTVMFFNMWSFVTRRQEDVLPYRPQNPACTGAGLVQPYADSPLEDEPVGETVYLKLINQARRYIYLTTPYLIIDHATTLALTAAAKSGVDVRIITPHIPDKKVVFEVTRAHYEALIQGGVKIYEYTPGFIHAKNFAVDDCVGTVGSVNMDYRSMFLHYENGVVLYDPDIVAEIKADFLETQKVSEQITEEMCRRAPPWRRALRAFLRIFAPLM